MNRKILLAAAAGYAAGAYYDYTLQVAQVAASKQFAYLPPASYVTDGLASPSMVSIGAAAAAAFIAWRFL